jgi:serine/threonine-protein kinase
VSAQLTNVSDGLALWSDTYERQAKDVFEVQDDIARSISDALKLKLGAQASTVASTSHGTDNLQAYDLYLRGIYFWNARGDANLRRSISYFEQAVATDPRFGRAYAALASAYALLPEYTDSPPADVLARTQNASNRALAIDSTLAQAHTALGLASVHAWDYETARHQYEMAIASDPRYPTAHQWYGEFLYRTNQVDSAIVEIGKARALDPLSPIITGAMGLALNLAGRYGECITEMKKGIELAPGIGLLQVMIAQCYAYAGDFPRAIRSAELGVSADKGLAMREGQLAYVYGVVGEKAKAAALAEKLTVRARTPPGQWFPVALAEIGIGNKAEALTALEKAVAAHEIGLAEVSLVSDKMWDSVWADPRFQRILEQTNLARYAQPRRR